MLSSSNYTVRCCHIHAVPYVGTVNALSPREFVVSHRTGLGCVVLDPPNWHRTLTGRFFLVSAILSLPSPRPLAFRLVFS